jgi:hypothetical protein
MRGFWIAGVSMALGLLCTVLAPNSARAGDEQLFAGLVPGVALPEQALGDIHGRGVSSSSSFGQDDESAGFASIDLRKMLSETLRSVGVRPPLVPSAGLETRPTVDLSAGRVSSFDMGRAANPARISLPAGVGSVSLPRAPSLPNLSSFGGGSSFGTSSVGSSSSISR